MYCMFRRTQPATKWTANEDRAVVTVLGMWKHDGLKLVSVLGLKTLKDLYQINFNVISITNDY